MSEHPDCALVRRGYEAFGRGDMEMMSTLLTADVIHHVPGNNPLSGHHKGRRTSSTSTAGSVRRRKAPSRYTWNRCWRTGGDT
ncbi:nuclear transport factor 2 family protein [Streptomyces sp. MS1.HAVA.3]|uniref:Nuclear transport factor 2 family protein n=1 Tax=Streptomyces caledonius TaxID=3134107 RepID=A0ABU8U9H1_9ACTN